MSAPEGGTLEIDLGALRANYRHVAREAREARTGASVKADAYGLGAVAVAGALATEGCRDFFVAHWSEAQALAPSLPGDALIFVLNGLPPGSAAEAAAMASAVPVINSREQAAAWAAEAHRRGHPLPAALHIDTGMSRLGLTAGEAAELPLDALSVKLVMSHLSEAEDPSASSNSAHLAAFREAIAAFPGVPASLANGSGVLLGPDYRFDLVRPGAALYGVNPTPGHANPMRPVLRLDARVIQLRDLPAGARVGYGGTFTAPHAMRTATIGLGYGDGWPRRAQLAEFFGGVRLPMIGRISMDTLVLDVSALDGQALRPGDEVTLLDETQTVDSVGEAAGTIGYEVLTSLGAARRLARRYVGE